MATYRDTLRRVVTLGPPAISAVSVAFCLVLTVLAVKGQWAPLPRAVIGAAGLAATGAVWFRDRWPVAVAVVGAAAYALSGNPGPLLIGLFSGAGARLGMRFAALAAIGVAGFLAQQWVDNGRFSTDALVSALAATAAALVAGGYTATRRELTSSLRERAERAETERHLRDEQAKTAERGRIAREMHDVLAHKVTLISLHAGGLEVNPGAEPVRVEREAALIRATAQEALEELRKIVGVLRAGHDDKFPDLRRLVESWASAGNTVTLDADLGTLPVVTARAAYRLVQEGLTNAYKHASGAPVTVTVTGNPQDGVTITVTNERPLRPAAHSSGAQAGLVGLAERFRLIGGTVRGGPDDAGGWRLEGRLPWDASARGTHDQDAAGG
ncbi:Signal transduction histidine kinase [Nonomuraea solani]|uniref:histidine kinase n=1 Tax=Nonomuraea solani TaxID=1144553 RepID=A0A1H5Y0H7_9ACTN|nr:histidine kinase [Nonomuraea solani]SEG17120.1 Signal transduction histidine kinase [Nonomuraea solani]